jgi:DEAD/DEAH box helicase domain-containing protein
MAPIYYTVAVPNVLLRVVQEHGTRPLGGGGAAFEGDVSVREEITAYKKVRFETNENLGYGAVSLPPAEMETEAMWIEPGEAAAEAVGGEALWQALAGIGHALHQIVALRQMCDPRDLAIAVQAAPAAAGEPTADRLALYVYDAHPGGVGLSSRAFGRVDDLLADTGRLVRGCPCTDGCPSCVGPRDEEGAPVKRLAVALLGALGAGGGGAW